MSEQIKIVQAENPIIDNLINTENKLGELNQEVNAILENYNTIKQTDASFFNFDNPFFLLTLAGLFMLVFALWFLKKELKFERNKKKFKDIKKADLEIKEKIKIAEIVEQKRKNEEKIKTKKLKTSKKIGQSKGRKIKVVKIK